jgi:hypothetical protein
MFCEYFKMTQVFPSPPIIKDDFETI